MINKAEVYSLLDHNGCGASDSQTDKSFHTTSQDYSFLSKTKTKNYQLYSSGITKSKISTFQQKENNPFFSDKFKLNQYSIERNTQDLSTSLSQTSTKLQCSKYCKKQPVKAIFFNKPLKQNQIKIKAQSPVFSKANNNKNNNKHSNIEQDEYFAQINKKESDSTKLLNHSQSIIDAKSVNSPSTEQSSKLTKSQPKQQGCITNVSPKNQQLKIYNLLQYPKQSKFKTSLGSKKSSNVQSPSNLQDLTNLSVSRNSSKKTNLFTLRRHGQVKEEKENQPMKINQSQLHVDKKSTQTQVTMTKSPFCLQPKPADNTESKKFRSLSKFSNTTQISNSSKNSQFKQNHNQKSLQQTNKKSENVLQQQQFKTISSGEYSKKLQEEKKQKELKDQLNKEKKQQMAKTLTKLRESSKERVSTYLTKGSQNFKKFEIKTWKNNKIVYIIVEFNNILLEQIEITKQINPHEIVQSLAIKHKLNASQQSQIYQTLHQEMQQLNFEKIEEEELSQSNESISTLDQFQLNVNKQIEN